MALEDRDIFTAIFAKYSDQPIEFVMEQYEKAKLLNMAIEKRLWDQSRVVACPASESPAQEEYKKLCGYSEQQKLMAHNLLAKLTTNAQRAQAARAAKRAEAHS